MTSYSRQAIAITIALAVSSTHAEQWVEVYRAGAGAGINTNTQVQLIDMDSVERTGPLVRYRVINKGWREVMQWLYGDCDKATRGTEQDRLYEVYPNTLAAADLKAACSAAPKLAQSEPAQVPLPSPKSAAPTPSPRAAAPRAAAAETSTGTGFAVAPNLVVTNFHVVEDCTTFSVRVNGNSSVGTLVATAKGNDLALLSVESRVLQVPPIRTSAALGEDVIVAGHPLFGLLGSDLIVTSGQVNSLSGLRGDPMMLQISAPVQPGNSGGPLIDRSGAIVGVVVSKLNVQRVAKLTGDMAQNVNFAIKPEVLRLFLDANRVTYRSSSLGQRFDGIVIADRARRFTVQVSCE